MSTLEKAFKVYSDTIRRIFNPNWMRLFYSFQQSLYKKINLSYFLNHNIYYESNPWISSLNISPLQEEQLLTATDRVWDQADEQKSPSFRIRIMRGLTQITQNIRRLVQRPEQPVKTLPETKLEENIKAKQGKIPLNRYIEEISHPLIQASPFRMSETEKKIPARLFKPAKIPLVKPSLQPTEEEIKLDKKTSIELIEPVTIPLAQDMEEKIQLKNMIEIIPAPIKKYNKVDAPKKILEKIILMNTLLSSHIRNISNLNRNYIQNIVDESELSPEQLVEIKQNYNYNAMNLAKLSPTGIIQSSEGLLLRSEIARQRLINIPRTAESEEKILELSSKIIKEKMISGKLDLGKEEEIKTELLQQKIREIPSITSSKTGEIIDIIEEKKIIENVLQPTIILKSLSEEMKLAQVAQPSNLARINFMEILRRLNSFVYKEESKVTPVIRRMSQISNIKNTLLGFRVLEKLSGKTYDKDINMPVVSMGMYDVVNISNDYLTKQLISSIANLSMFTRITSKIEEEKPFESPIANIRIPDIIRYGQPIQQPHQQYVPEQLRRFARREQQVPFEVKVEADIEKIDLKDLERRLARLLRDEARRRGIY